MIVGMRDVRSLNWCRKGAKDFCDRHGIDWDTFRTTGVDQSEFEKTGDSMALQLVEKANENGR